MQSNGYVPHIGWVLNLKIPKYGSQNVYAPLEMDSSLHRNKNFSRYLFSSLDFLDLSCENWFVVTLSSINIPLQRN